MADDFGKQTKLEAFRQHWEQIRHAENHRNTFGAFYGAAVMGVVAFIAQTNKTVADSRFLLLALGLLSSFGWLLCKRVKELLLDFVKLEG